MKQKLIALTTALSLGTIAMISAQDSDDSGAARHRRGDMGGHKSPLDRVEQLNLTPEQKTKVQPLLDQAKPQIQAIRQEAMQKMKTVVDNTMSQIRPLLTPEQQQKLDTMPKGRGPRGKGDADTD